MENDDIVNKIIETGNVIYLELGSNCIIGDASDAKITYVHGSQIHFKPQPYAQCTNGKTLAPVANLPPTGSRNYSTRTSTKTTTLTTTAITSITSSMHYTGKASGIRQSADTAITKISSGDLNLSLETSIPISSTASGTILGGASEMSMITSVVS